MTTTFNTDSASVSWTTRLFVLAITCQFLLLSGCSNDNKRTNTIEVTAGPTLTANTNLDAPLAATLALETDAAAAVRLTIDDGTNATSVAFPGRAVSHTLPVLGLKPNTSYTVSVTIIDAAGLEKDLDQTLSLTTDPLPADFPQIEVLVSEPDQMEPGFTMLRRIIRGRDADPAIPTYSMILNASGEVVWYGQIGSNNMRFTEAGTMVSRIANDVVETDMLGNVLNTTTLLDPGVGLHHELFLTEDGTYISLSKQVINVDNYPTNRTDPVPRQTVDILDEPVVEFSATGEVVGHWPLADILDTARINHSALGPTPQQALDWVHTNAALHDPSDDSIIVSIRHQDALVKFDRTTGDLIWILGPHDNWSSDFQPYLLNPTDPNFQWQYHQHAPMITAEGTLMVFDNGNFKTSPFDGKTSVAAENNYTRAVEYAIDESTMAISQVWEYGSQTSPRLYARFIGDADALPETGNVLITFGGTGFIDGAETSTLGYGPVVARIAEVTRMAPAEKVFEVMLSDESLWVGIYRSNRIPSLYAEGVVVTSLN